MSSLTVAQILRRGGVGVLATDTLYGLVGPALNRQSVERVYRLKSRNPDKPFIILIGSLGQLELFGVTVDANIVQRLSGYWPGAVSVILPCKRPELAYLHRGTNSLAFRLPAKPYLRRLLSRVGPLVAPSANPEGELPALKIGQAKQYFGDRVDFYRSGNTSQRPSKLIKIEGDHESVLRA